jgi:hypothetical protein
VATVGKDGVSKMKVGWSKALASLGNKRAKKLKGNAKPMATRAELTGKWEAATLADPVSSQPHLGGSVTFLLLW